ncbi:MAG: hypothetical protein IPN71_10000 [Fibrobacteres bacterium]|nr:hypothetical protein [Fibrobacterota bacterium]
MLTWRLISGPVGATINEKTGLLTWDTAKAVTNGVPFQIEVSDPSGAKSIQSWVVRTVVSTTNLPPQFLTNASWVVRVGDSLVVPLSAVDPEGGRIVFSKISGPAGAVLRGSTLAWTPVQADTGLKSFVLRATDSVGAYVEVSGWVRVYVPTQTPVIRLRSVSSAKVGEPFKAYVEASSVNGLDSVGLRFGNLPIVLNQGVATMTPNTAGTFDLIAKARDKFGLTATSRLPVEVLAAPPVELLKPVPSVNLTWTPTAPKAGDTVSFTVTASSALGISAKGLRIEGTSIALNASGVGKWLARTPGTVALLATAYDIEGASISIAKSLSVGAVAGAGTVSASLLSPRATDSAETSKLPEITGSQDVRASISGAGLAQWILEISSNGKDWKNLKTGTLPQTNAVIGAVDATLLENGMYTLRVRALSKDGSIATDTSTVWVRGERKVGIFTIGFTDLSLPMPGMDLGVNRQYDSRRSAFRGDFGYGWSLDMSRVEVSTSRPEGTGWYTPFGPAGLTRLLKTKSFPKITIRIPGGRTQEFEAKASFDNPLQPYHGVMQYVALPGTYGKLDPADVTHSWIRMNDLLVANDQVAGDNGELKPYSPTQFILTHQRQPLVDRTRIWQNPSDRG